MSAVSVDVDMLAHLPAKTLLQLVEQSQRCTRHMTRQQKTVQDFPALFRQLEQWEIEIGFEISWGDINVRVTGDGDKFGDVWGELRRNGFEPSERPKKGDTGYSGAFKLVDPNEQYARIWLTFTSTVCRRVKVGTKMVEQDVYETRCEGALPELTATQDPPALPSAPSEDGELESAF